MFTLCVKDSFAAAHRLVGYLGRCEELHGHNFVVEAFFSGDKLGDDGLLVDFKILKDHLKNVLDALDHKYLNELPFFLEKTSSAEHIALYIYGEMEKKMKGTKAYLKEIRVWESDKAYASYER
jgi:6-pyruvoyltetrahydropterin/6-carboxytetrahydropterin synthase